MSAAAAKLGDFGMSYSSTSGVSDLSTLIKDARESAFGHFRESFTNKKPQDLLNDELFQVLSDCSGKNWDGYGARPISLTSFIEVQSFITKIDSLPIPDVSAHPDGELALDWYGDGGDVFSMSFGEAKKVSYAGHFEGGSVIHGRERSDSLDMEFMERLIRRALQGKKEFST